jgi:hypothetical protein
LLEELEAKGYCFQNVVALQDQNDPLPLEAIRTILKWLPHVYDEHLGTGDCLLRSLYSAGEQYDPSVLIDLFENSDHNETVKSCIGRVLSLTPTGNISGWLKYQLSHKPHSFGRAGLLDGIVPKGDFQSKEELKQFLIAIFDKYAYYEAFQRLFQKYGDPEDIPFLVLKSQQLENKRTAREIRKVADKISTRKRAARFPQRNNIQR